MSRICWVEVTDLWGAAGQRYALGGFQMIEQEAFNAVLSRPGCSGCIAERIDPTREGLEELEKIKRVLGSYVFEAQYQQNPLPVEGNLLKRSWLRTYPVRPADEDLDAIVHSWDTAAAAMKRYGRPEVIVTDRLRSYWAAMREIGNEARQETGRWLNNRAENSHQPFRRRERAMAKFRSGKVATEMRLDPLFNPQLLQ